MRIFESLHRKAIAEQQLGHDPGSVKSMGGNLYIVRENGQYEKLKGKELAAVAKIISTPSDQLRRELGAGD